jgi:hypothetical protein
MVSPVMLEKTRRNQGARKHRKKCLRFDGASEILGIVRFLNISEDICFGSAARFGGLSSF